MKLLEIKVKDHHIRALWWSLKAMIENDIDNPFGTKRLISLMETLGTKYKKTNKEYSLKLSEDDFRVCFDCIKTVLDNLLVPKAEQLPTFKEAIERVAIAIDTKFLQQHLRPFEILDGGKK